MLDSKTENGSDTAKQDELQVMTRLWQIPSLSSQTVHPASVLLPELPTKETSFGDFSSLPAFNVEPFVSPYEIVSKGHSEQEDLQVLPKARQTVFLSPRTQYAELLPLDTSRSANQALFGDFSSLSMFNVESAMLNYPFTSPFATCPRSQTNGKTRTFAVLPDSKTTFWNFASADSNLRSASLGRQKSASTISPFRLNQSQQNGILRISSANPYADAIANENEYKAADELPSMVDASAEPFGRSRLPIYESQSESDDLEDRERMKAIEALLCQEKKEQNGESYELRSSFNEKKCYDLRVSEDANRGMIRDYLVQRQNDQAQTNLFRPAGDGEDSAESEKNEKSVGFATIKMRKVGNQETAVEVPTAKNDDPSSNPAESDDNESNVDGQANRNNPMMFKTSEFIYKSFDPNVQLSERQVMGLKISKFVPYIIWVFITNLLLLTFFWVIID